MSVKILPSQQLKFVSYLLLITLLFATHPIFAQSKSKRKAVKSSSSTIIIANNGTSRYRIVLPAAATPSEQKAAKVLQEHLIEISGVALPIIAASKDKSSYEIVLGQNERLDQATTGIDLNALKEDGYAIKTDSMRLFIAGGTEKGTLYGVYSFLEKHLGCRMYSAKVKYVPKQNKLELPRIAEQHVPVMVYRDTHYRGAWDAEYTDWHKLDHDEKGGRPEWGMWVHTFNELVPPATYYKDHPEYYAMVDGKRIPTQLCLTNPGVLKVTVQNLRKKIAENPAAKYWSVSQNDNKNPCTCDKCKALDEKEGSHSGTIVNFANQVADQFPEKIISTLAYEYGRKAPKTLKPRKNVNIMLCSIELYRNLPITEDPTAADFMQDVQEWGKIANDIIVWDYVIQFPNLVSPFPNLHVLQPNIQFFAKNGVSAMFEQGNREVGGEFADLRAYLISKLLWEPDANADSIMNDFLNGYYGSAGKPIRKYIDEMKAALIKSGAPLRIFGSPNEAATSYLTPQLIKRYEAIFDEAEMAVSTDAILLERVRIARQPLEFAIMEQAKKNYYGNNGVFEKVNGKWEVKSSIRSKIDPFTDLAIREGVTQVKEWSTSPDEYRSAMYRLFSQGMNEHLAYGKKVSFVSPDSAKLPKQAAVTLTDGIRGSHDYAYNWLSFNGKDLEAIVDLEEAKPIRRIESAYYQYGFWLMLFPKKVEYYTSMDGKNYKKVAELQNTLPIDQYGGQQRDFIAEFAQEKARFVKVKAYTIGNTPAWHPGGGRAPNMLIDEIVVE